MSEAREIVATLAAIALIVVAIYGASAAISRWWPPAPQIINVTVYQDRGGTR